MRATDLAARLGRQADAVARYLLPKGQRRGAEWRCGGTNGEPGESLGVHLAGDKAGVWSDFSSGEKGDLIGLWMAARNLSLADACREASEYLGLPDDRPSHPVRQYRKPDREGVSRLSVEHLEWLLDVRKLPADSIEAYKLASRGDRLMFPYLRGGDLIFAKYRKLPKQFSAEGDCEPILFGWQVIPKDARGVILAEGELDAIAWHGYGFPALSVPTGANGHKWIESEYSALEPFDTIYLSLDMDEAGQRSIRELSDRLGRERCKIVSLPHKDANECLMRGVSREDMTRALSSARTLDPAELRNIGEFEEAIVAEATRTDEGLYLPWKKTHHLIRLRPGEVSIWPGMNGHGKSQVTSHVVAYNATGGVRCCVASMEWRTSKWAWRMQRQIGAVARPSDAYSRTITKALTETLWTFNVIGSSKAERILEVFRYARQRYRIELFLIDNLTKCGFADDDYAGQKRFVEALADFARESDCHVMLVAHMRKSDHGEDQPSGKFGVKGSGGITDMAATVIEVWRNKSRERAKYDADQTGEPMPEKYQPNGPRGMDTMLYVHKQNENGEEPSVPLWFDKETGQFLSRAHYRPRPMLALAGLGAQVA